MERLLRIEWLKLRHYRPFWVLLALYTIFISLICLGVHFFFIWLKNQGADFEGMDPTIIPFYDFPDIWQNITYIATFLKLFLAFIVIISVSNEITYRTLRQNIIDGMSKRGWIFSKLLLIGALALLGTSLLFILGLFTGLLWSHPHGYPHILGGIPFLLAYFLEVFTYLTFTLWIILIIRRIGLVIVGLMMYTLAFEPAVAAFMMYYPHSPTFVQELAAFLPVRALNNLIHVPFQRYAMQEVQDYISFKEVLIVLGWLALNISISYRILTRRDL
jgi:hypothetical protein